MSRSSKLRLSSMAIALVLAVPPIVSLPSPGWSQVDELIVTTRRREESLQDIPVSVTAFTAEVIENQAIRTTADVLKLVPGVQFDQQFSANDTRIAIRGINNSRGRTSAAILVDGVDVSGETINIGGGSSLLNTRLLDLERVEVVKGPQSALYGRNAFAGAINYITKRPSLDSFEGYLSGDVAEHGRYEIRGAIGGPIINDVLAVRLNAATYDLDGYYTNPITGSDLSGGESDGIGASFLLKPFAGVSVFANVTYSDDSSTQRAAVVAKPNTLFPNGFSAFLGTLPDGRESDIQISASDRTGGDFAGSKDETLRASVIAEWDLGSVTIKSLTGYLKNDSSVNEDVEYQDGVGIGLTSVSQDFFNETDTTYWSQEFTVSSNSEGRFNWIIGALGFWENTGALSDSQNWFQDGALNPGFGFFCGFFLPCTFDQSAAFGAIPKLVDRDTTSYSVYGLVGWDITEQLNVTFEGRYIYDRIEVSTNTPISRTEQTILGCPSDGSPNFFTCFIDQSDPSVFPLTDSKITNSFNPRVSVDYQAMENVLLYASAAKGTKPGGFATTQMTNPSVNAVDQEKLWSYEIGAKTSWFDNTVRANIAGYFSQYTDRQVGLTVPCGSGGAFVCSGNGNAGEVDVLGAELSVLWQPNENFAFGFGYSYVDAEFVDFDFEELRGGPPSVGQAALCGPELDGDCDGAYVAGVAENALAMVADYNAPLFAEFNWFIQADAQWTGKRPLDSREITPFVDDFWNVDLQIGIESELLRIAVYAENLLDNDTPRNGQIVNDFKDGLTPFGSPRDEMAVAFLPPPRVIGARATIRFGSR